MRPKSQMFRFLFAALCSFIVLCIARCGVHEPGTLRNGQTLLVGEDLSRPLIAGDLIIVGDMNAFYILNGTREQKVDWRPGNVEECRNKGFDEHECQNYVRVLQLDDNGIAIIHGTDATSPIQRTYQINETGVVTSTKEEPVERATSFFQQKESLFLEINKTVNFAAGFANRLDSAQICKNGHVCTPSSPPLFNEPKFLKMIANDKYVYAVYMDNITLQSRQRKNIKQPHITRVCVNDRGAITTSGSVELTTYIKTRLECFLKDLHYTKLVAVSESYNATCNNDKPCTAFAGVFLAELPIEKRYSVTVCQFDFEDIDHIFDQGTFVNQTGLPVDNDEVPNPRPGQCQFGSTILAKDCRQMLQTIKGVPILSIEGSQVSSLSVDNVMSDDGNPYQMFYLGTNRGSLFRYTIKNGTAETFRETQILAGGQTVRHIGWQNKEMEPSQRQLIVSTETEIVQIQPYQCSIEDLDWTSFVRRQDPKCSWNDEIKSCSSVTNPQEVDWGQQFQDLITRADSNISTIILRFVILLFLILYYFEIGFKEHREKTHESCT